MLSLSPKSAFRPCTPTPSHAMNPTLIINPTSLHVNPPRSHPHPARHTTALRHQTPPHIPTSSIPNYHTWICDTIKPLLNPTTSSTSKLQTSQAMRRGAGRDAGGVGRHEGRSTSGACTRPPLRYRSATRWTTSAITSGQRQRTSASGVCGTESSVARGGDFEMGYLQSKSFLDLR